MDGINTASSTIPTQIIRIGGELTKDNVDKNIQDPSGDLLTPEQVNNTVDAGVDRLNETLQARDDLKQEKTDLIVEIGVARQQQANVDLYVQVATDANDTQSSNDITIVAPTVNLTVQPSPSNRVDDFLANTAASQDNDQNDNTINAIV